jgi:hypothetical protein
MHFKNQKSSHKTEINSESKNSAYKDFASKQVFSIVLFILIVLPWIGILQLRFTKEYYWQNPFPEKHITVKYSSNDFEKSNKTLTIEYDSITETHNLPIYICKNSGDYKIKTEGKFMIGLFNRNINATGIRIGFWGFPMGNVWNIDKSLDVHAEVIYRINSSNWASLYPDEGGKSYTNIFTQEKKIMKGDTLQLLINDKEYQNNKGDIKITIE